MRHPLILVLVTLSFVALSACGSGSPPAPVAVATAPSFAGEWHIVLLQAGGGDVTAYWGSAVSQASGQTELTLDVNDDGARPADEVSTVAATVSADGTLGLVGAPRAFEGGISKAGDMAVFAALPGTPPTIGLLLRKEGVFDNAVLNGSYHWAAMRTWGGAPATMSQGSPSFSFDGMGGMVDDGVAINNLDGVVTGFGFGGTSYGVSPDGGVSLAGTAGGVLAGGEAFITGGYLAVGVDPTITAYVAQSSGATNARFLGTYAIAGLQYDFTGIAHRSTTGRLIADGAGGGTVSGVQSIETVEFVIAPAGVTSSVDPDGTLHLTLPGGDSFVGGLSPDGRMAILHGGTANGMDPALFVLVRLD